MKKADRDFLRQLHFWLIVDRIFTYVTPFGAALIALAGIYLTLKGGK